MVKIIRWPRYNIIIYMKCIRKNRINSTLSIWAWIVSGRYMVHILYRLHVTQHYYMCRIKNFIGSA